MYLILKYSTEVNSDSAFLSEEDCALFNPVCKTLALPVQAPMSVCFEKKIAVVEKPTGRIIEYKSCSDSANPKTNSSSIVSPTTSTTHDQFGQITSLFIYRGKHFAIMKMFECAVHKNNDGLVRVADCTINRKTLFPLEEVSRPLLIAIEQFPEL